MSIRKQKGTKIVIMADITSFFFFLENQCNFEMFKCIHKCSNIQGKHLTNNFKFQMVKLKLIIRKVHVRLMRWLTVMQYTITNIFLMS